MSSSDAYCEPAAATTPMAPLGEGVTIEKIREAAETISGFAHYTPLIASRALSDVVGHQVKLKCENLQRAGSFKVRGALTRLSHLTPAEKARGVVAASAGNHAQGVAVAAAHLNIATTVFMPTSAAIPKIAATRGYGASVELGGADLGETMEIASEYADRTGAIFIHPFDHHHIVAGQGTIGLEIIEQMPDVRYVVVPVGGGGLIAGIATALAAVAPQVQVIGVQAAGAAAFDESISVGKAVTATQMATMADGIAVPTPGRIAFELCQRHGVQMRTVTEEQLSQGLVLLAERVKLVVEPAGAAAVASLLANSEFDGPVCAVLSGGNIDPVVLLRVIRHGLTAAKRYFSISSVVKDRPGALAGLLACLANLGVSILHVSHLRTWDVLAVDEVGVTIEVETRGPEHCQVVMQALREHGYPVL